MSQQDRSCDSRLLNGASCSNAHGMPPGIAERDSTAAGRAPVRGWATARAFFSAAAAQVPMLAGVPVRLEFRPLPPLPPIGAPESATCPD
jgi:hypothetical protein